MFSTTLAVTWWCLTLAHLIKMWHVTITRLGYYLATGAIWTVAGLIAVGPLISSRVSAECYSVENLNCSALVQGIK